MVFGIGAKKVDPLGSFKVRQGRGITGDCCKPVVKHDVELRSDGSGAKIEDERDRASMSLARANVHVSFGSWRPLWNLLTISNPLVKNIDWATPDMQVLELGLRPAGSGEDVERTEAGVERGHAVPDVDRMLDRHGPERGVRHFGPVDGRVEEHCSSNGDDGSDGALCFPVLMVGADSSCSGMLLEGAKVVGIILGGEGSGIIGEVLLGYDSMVPTAKLILLLCFDGFVGVEVGLELDINMTRGMVDKKATTRVEFSAFGAAS